MADYVSKYTGAQIDEAVGKALEGGTDGVSPVITTSKSGSVTTLTITDATGTKTATISDGATVEDVLAALPTWNGGDY